MKDKYFVIITGKIQMVVRCRWFSGHIVEASGHGGSAVSIGLYLKDRKDMLVSKTAVSSKDVSVTDQHELAETSSDETAVLLTNISFLSL